MNLLRKPHQRFRQLTAQTWFRQNLILTAGLAIVVAGLSITYAALNTQLSVTGSARLTANAPTRIVNVSPATPNSTCGYAPYPPTWTDTTVTVDGALPQLPCTLTFDLTVRNDAPTPVIIREIQEQTFSAATSMQYAFSISPSDPNATIPSGGELSFTLTFSYRDGLSALPAQTDFTASFLLIFVDLSPPILTATNTSRHFELFRGDTTFTPASLNARVSALDDADGDITSQITKTCQTAAAGDVACPSTWATWPRGEYTVTYNVTNSLGLAAVPITMYLKLWDFIRIDSGQYHSVATTSHGKFYTWGRGASYRQGLSDLDNRLAPVKHPLSDSAYIVDAVACDDYGHAIDSDGNLWSWGDGSEYALGTGNVNVQRTPVKVGHPAGEKYVTVDCFYESGTALTDAGNVYTWGWSSYGANAGGSATDIRVPTKVSRLSNIVYINQGYYNGGAIDATGQLYTWGTNGEGELGVGFIGARASRGVSAYYNLPADWNGIRDAKAICFGSLHAILIRQDGTVQTWGQSRGYGLLGTGTYSSNIYSPTTIGVAGATGCDAQRYGSSVWTADGTAYYWGSNDYGELGTGSASAYIATPTALANKPGVTMTTMQMDSSHALVDGIIAWAVGYNLQGGLGINTSSNTATVTNWVVANTKVEW
jgi:alpha-tubulin suppressor-like RCC1 family protein